MLELYKISICGIETHVSTHNFMVLTINSQIGTIFATEKLVSGYTTALSFTGQGLDRMHLCELLRQMAWCWRIKRPMSTKQSEAVFLRLFSSWRLLLLKGPPSPRGHSLLASV